MRELKDYFCTFNQRQKLIELGFDGDAHIISAEYYYKIDTPFEGILRSQALDFFRDKGYLILISNDGYTIFYRGCSTSVGNILSQELVEYDCIQTLIELETEAQHGN